MEKVLVLTDEWNQESEYTLCIELFIEAVVSTGRHVTKHNLDYVTRMVNNCGKTIVISKKNCIFDFDQDELTCELSNSDIVVFALKPYLFPSVVYQVIERVNFLKYTGRRIESKKTVLLEVAKEDFVNQNNNLICIYKDLVNKLSWTPIGYEILVESNNSSECNLSQSFDIVGNRIYLT